MVARAMLPGAAAVAIAFVLGLAFAGPGVAFSAALGVLVAVANFAASGYLLSWAASISLTAVQLVVLGGFVLRLGAILGLMVALSFTHWFSAPAFGLAVALPPCLCSSLSPSLVIRGSAHREQGGSDQARTPEPVDGRLSLMGPLLAARAGFPTPTTDDFVWPCLTPHLRVLSFDLCINREVLLTFLAAAVVLSLFLLAFRRPSMVPTGLQNFMEVIVDFVRAGIVLEVIGEQGLRFVPYLTTLFFFVFTANVFGVIPGLQFPVTSRMALPIFLALLSWILFNVVGIKEHGLGVI